MNLEIEAYEGELRELRKKREWVGLTEDEMAACWKSSDIVAEVEAKLKEKNT